MLRSRLLLRIAAPLALFGSAACHSGEEAQSPSTSRAETTETTGADAPAVQEHDARTALNAASPGLKACGRDGAPTAIDAEVRFEPSGNVSTVEVKPAVEPVATCVREKLEEVAILPFRGEPLTVRMHIRI